jgi:hypothetical protein
MSDAMSDIARDRERAPEIDAWNSAVDEFDRNPTSENYTRLEAAGRRLVTGRRGYFTEAVSEEDVDRALEKKRRMMDR